jgi:hypothetical protein
LFSISFVQAKGLKPYCRSQQLGTAKAVPSRTIQRLVVRRLALRLLVLPPERDASGGERRAYRGSQ